MSKQYHVLLNRYSLLCDNGLFSLVPPFFLSVAGNPFKHAWPLDKTRWRGRRPRQFDADRRLRLHSPSAATGRRSGQTPWRSADVASNLRWRCWWWRWPPSPSLQEEPAKDGRHLALRHWQVQPRPLPGQLYLLQPDVLDHLPEHLRGGRTRSGPPRGVQLKEGPTGGEGDGGGGGNERWAVEEWEGGEVRRAKIRRVRQNTNAGQLSIATTPQCPNLHSTKASKAT